MSAATLLADPTCLRLERIVSSAISLTLVVRTTGPAVACPSCGTMSERVHSRYVRRAADLPWHGVAVRLELHARKFFCAGPGCPRRVFTERLPRVVAPHARRTRRLNEALTLLAFALGGEAGARAAPRPLRRGGRDATARGEAAGGGRRRRGQHAHAQTVGSRGDLSRARRLQAAEHPRPLPAVLGAALGRRLPQRARAMARATGARVPRLEGDRALPPLALARATPFALAVCTRRRHSSVAAARAALTAPRGVDAAEGGRGDEGRTSRIRREPVRAVSGS
jgi:zinc-finger of transposase IS204/IS1001/IS1096/IS1165